MKLLNQLWKYDFHDKSFFTSDDPITTGVEHTQPGAVNIIHVSDAGDVISEGVENCRQLTPQPDNFEGKRNN